MGELISTKKSRNNAEKVEIYLLLQMEETVHRIFLNILLTYTKNYTRDMNQEPGDELNGIYQSINSRIDETLLQDIDKGNTQTVAPALNKLKSSKSDSVFDFNSDCSINSPPELIQRVKNLFKWFLGTRKVPAFLLLCKIVPIVKDNIGDITSSDNYRAIDIRSLILKLLDWLIIILEEENLSTDELQFRFFRPTAVNHYVHWEL